MLNFDTHGHSSTTRPRPYMRFLLRQGEQRGRRLAVLIPSLVYLGLAIYPLLETVTRMLLFSYDATQGDLIGKGFLAGIGLIGTLVNATVMWVMTGPTVTTSPWWNLGLTVPLFLMLAIVSVLFGLPSSASYAESMLRGMVLTIILLFGYLRANTAAGLWPSYRPYLPQYYPRDSN